MKELKNFIRISQKLLEEYLERKTEDEIEKNPDDYCIGESDYGYYHNGVGFASCGGYEREYDTDKAREYALDDIELDNPSDDIYYHLTENKEFVKAFRALLEVL